MKVLILLLMISIIFIFSEYLYNKKKIKQEYTRKIVHISNSVLISYFPYIFNLKEVLFLGLVLSIIIIFSKKNNYLKSVFNVERETIGAIIFIPSLMVIAFLFWNNFPQIFTISTLILGFSDSFAAIIGKKLGKYKSILNKNKTYEGFLAFFIITLLILIVSFLYVFNYFNLFILIKIILISLILSLIELISRRGLDNFLIPLMSSIMIYYFLWI